MLTIGCSQLYFFPNGTGNSTVPLVAVTLQNLISIQGDGAGPAADPATIRPVKNITILGIELRDAGYTYLNPHGAPSGGA